MLGLNRHRGGAGRGAVWAAARLQHVAFILSLLSLLLTRCVGRPAPAVANLSSNLDSVCPLGRGRSASHSAGLGGVVGAGEGPSCARRSANEGRGIH